MTDRRLAARYAGALLAVLTDPGRAAEADAFLSALGQAMVDTPAFRELMVDPGVSADRRTAVLRAIAADAGMAREMGNFLATLVSRGRAAALPAIAEEFRAARERAAGTVAAEITTAAPLPEDLRQRAVAVLERITSRKVRLTCRVEPGLLGGAVTRIGSQMYDGSLRTQLAGLGRRMRQE